MALYNSELLDGERIDETGFGQYVVIQGKGFSYGVDSVLLAAFANGETGAPSVEKDSTIVDLGTGNGIIPFILAHKTECGHITGVEVQAQSFDRAVRGATINNLNERITFEHMDINECPYRYCAGCMDYVVTNPPYFKRGAAMISDASAKMIARHETTAVLDDFMRVAAHLLKRGGGLYMVHRPDRLVSIMTSMRGNGIEPKTIQFVAPRPGEAANILLIHGVKGAGEELKVLPELYVYGGNREYSDEIMRIYERV